MADSFKTPGYAITKGVTLASRTGIGLGGQVIAEARLDDERGCEALPELERKLGGRVCFLGAGTNIIASDEPLPLVLAALPKLVSAQVTGEKNETVFLQASGGMALPRLLARAALTGLGGLEGLCGIPGSVGGAVAMNAGSFGTETGNIVHSVRLFSPRLGIVEKTSDEFTFSYRKCVLKDCKDAFWVLGATFVLRRKAPNLIKEAMREVWAKKMASQPVKARSAGCVFKNPTPQVSAGRLLSEAGFRGFALGGMRFSSLHANFLVNEGNGTAEQAFELIERARQKVLELSGHVLETEVTLWR